MCVCLCVRERERARDRARDVCVDLLKTDNNKFSLIVANGYLESPEALSNPYSSNVTLVNRLFNIPWLGALITDSHFFQRDRMGRMLTFVARIKTDRSLSADIVGLGTA